MNCTNKQAFITIKHVQSKQIYFSFSKFLFLSSPTEWMIWICIEQQPPKDDNASSMKNIKKICLVIYFYVRNSIFSFLFCCTRTTAFVGVFPKFCISNTCSSFLFCPDESEGESYYYEFTWCNKRKNIALLSFFVVRNLYRLSVSWTHSENNQ